MPKKVNNTAGCLFTIVYVGLINHHMIKEAFLKFWREEGKESYKNQPVFLLFHISKGVQSN